MRAFARNDGNYVPGASPNSTTVIQPNAPVGQNEIVKVMAHIVYGIRPIATRNTRTYWLAQNDDLSGTNQGLAAPGIITGIPPFARSVRITRAFQSAPPTAAMPPIAIFIYREAGGASDMMDGPISIPVGVECPEISLPDSAHSISVLVSGLAAGKINMAAVFEIGL